MRPSILVVISALSVLQSAAPPGIPEAMARLQAQDPAGALAIMEEVVKRDPANGRAWRTLGLSAHRAKRFDRAIEAYRKNLEIEPDQPTALYNLGATYAARQQPDDAFAWLRKARATRRIDMTQIQVDGDLAPLRGDPRFADLMPNPSDFANPFVEPVKVLHEFRGEAAHDQFGWIARPIGDVDGDRVQDFVTSAPGQQGPGSKSRGRVYVYSTRTGKLLWKVEGEEGAQLGTGVEAAGDVNRDGVPDVIASGPGRGHAFVYSGADGRVLLEMKSTRAGEQFGRHVAGTGDVNRDGHADVIVGAPGSGPGRAYVYSGSDGALLLELTGDRDGDSFGSTVAGESTSKGSFLVVGASAAGPARNGRTYVYRSLTPTAAFTIDADESGAALGAMFVSVVGDVDRDGTPDVYASDFSNRAKGPSTGRVYIHSGRTGERLRAFTGEAAGHAFGIGPAVAGDVNGDGHADLVIGAWQYSDTAISAGRVYLYSGRDGALLKTYTCRIPGDTFGFDAMGIGDADGDGIVDLLLTSAWSGVSGYHSGRVFVMSSGVARN